MTSAASPHPQRARAELVLLGTTAGWALTFPLAKDALSAASPNAYLAVRFAIGTLAAALIARGSLRDRTSLKLGAVLGLLLWAGFALNTWGLRFTTATRSGFGTSLALVLVPVLGALFFRQRIPAASWLGAGMAGAGMAWMSAPALREGGASALGDALTVMSAAVFALQILFIERFAARMRPAAGAAAQLAVVAVLSAACVPFEEVRFQLTPRLAAVLAFNGICASAIFISAQVWAQARTSAVRAALIFTLEPLLAAFFSRALLGDPLVGEVYQGGALIVLGLLTAELWPRLEAWRADAEAG